MTGFTLRDPNNIGVAVLGAGRMGRVHVRNLGTIPNANVIVVADPNPDAAEVSGTLTTLELRVGARVPLGAHAFVGLGARAGHVLSALDFAAESATGARRVAGFGGASGALQLELGLR